MSSTEQPPEATVWDDLTDEDIVSMLGDLQIEANAAVHGGDPAMSKWARSTGLFATALLDLLDGGDSKKEKNKDKDKPTASPSVSHTDKPAMEAEDKPSHTPASAPPKK